MKIYELLPGGGSGAGAGDGYGNGAGNASIYGSGNGLGNIFSNGGGSGYDNDYECDEGRGQIIVINVLTKRQEEKVMTPQKKIEILIVTHGWVVIGVVVDDGRESGEAEIAYAHTVAWWGTTEGLAQLCHTGPLPETRLNKMIPYGDRLRINRRHVIARLACDSSKWAVPLGVE